VTRLTTNASVSAGRITAVGEIPSAFIATNSRDADMRPKTRQTLNKIVPGRANTNALGKV